ncbi:MAG: lysylphosphatidylglycerol synthase domain-containing protein, partial [Nocardioides sp.]
RPVLRELGSARRSRVWIWSWVALGMLVLLSVATSYAVDLDASWRARLTIGLLILAGMAIPVNLGGWGPREAAGAVAATLVGLPPESGIAVAAGYGLLSTISVLPGFVVLATRGTTRAGRSWV